MENFELNINNYFAQQSDPYTLDHLVFEAEFETFYLNIYKCKDIEDSTGIFNWWYIYVIGPKDGRFIYTVKASPGASPDTSSSMVADLCSYTSGINEEILSRAICCDFYDITNSAKLEPHDNWITPQRTYTYTGDERIMVQFNQLSNTGHNLLTINSQEDGFHTEVLYTETNPMALYTCYLTKGDTVSLWGSGEVHVIEVNGGHVPFDVSDPVY